MAEQTLRMPPAKEIVRLLRRPENQPGARYAELVSIEFHIMMDTVGATQQELVDLPQQRST